MKFTITSLGENEKSQSKYANAAEERELSFPKIPNPETRRHVESVVGNNPARYLARGAAQVGAGVAGTPGNITSLGASAVNLGANLATGKDIPGHATLQKYLPTSENLIKGTESATGLNLGGGEKANALDRFISGTATLASGGVGIGRAAKIAGAGQLGRGAAKAAGVGEFGQAVADVGSSLLAGKLTSPNVKKKLQSIEKKTQSLADKNLPKHASGNASMVDEFINRELGPDGGIQTDAIKKIKEPFQAIGNSINKYDGTLSLDMAIDHKNKINTLIDEWSTNHRTPPEAIKALESADEILRDFIQSATEKSHPEFWKNWSVAEGLKQGLKPLPEKAKSQVKEIGEFIVKKGLSSAIGALLGGKVGSIAGPVLLQGAQYAFKKSKQFQNLIKKSPLARQEYQNALGALAMDNKALAAKSFAALNDIAEEAIMPKKFTITSLT